MHFLSHPSLLLSHYLTALSFSAHFSLFTSHLCLLTRDISSSTAFCLFLSSLHTYSFSPHLSLLCHTLLSLSLLHVALISVYSAHVFVLFLGQNITSFFLYLGWFFAPLCFHTLISLAFSLLFVLHTHLFAHTAHSPLFYALPLTLTCTLPFLSFISCRFLLFFSLFLGFSWFSSLSFYFS